jgi:hypothetical protein
MEQTGSWLLIFAQPPYKLSLDYLARERVELVHGEPEAGEVGEVADEGRDCADAIFVER